MLLLGYRYRKTRRQVARTVEVHPMKPSEKLLKRASEGCLLPGDGILACGAPFICLLGADGSLVAYETSTGRVVSVALPLLPEPVRWCRLRGPLGVLPVDGDRQAVRFDDDGRAIGVVALRSSDDVLIQHMEEDEAYRVPGWVLRWVALGATTLFRLHRS